MPINCPHLTASQTNPGGQEYHQCALVAQVTGFKGTWISENSSKNCQGDDLTSSACAKNINALLHMRLMAWRVVNAPEGCANCKSLDQALALVISREGKAAAVQALARAISEAQMPQAQAEALATAHGIQVD